MIADQRPETGLKYFIFIVISLNVATFAGCAVQPSPPVELQTPDFTAIGKIAYRSEGDNHTANFSWRQFDERYAVEVWGPLGQGRSQFSGDAEQMTVTRGDKLLAEGLPEEIMYTHLGWSLPVALVPQWLQGHGVTAENPRLEVAGWVVEFSRFGPLDSGSDSGGDGLHPKRLEARNGPQRLIVSIREFLQ